MSPRFIVVFKKDATQDEINKQADAIDQNGGSIKNRFPPTLLNGFSAEIPEQYLVMLQSNALLPDSAISYIEPDSQVTTQG